MATDLLNIEANQRMDLGDMTHAVDTSIQENAREPNTQFLTDPGKASQWIIDGFAIDNSDGAPFGGVQLRVSRGTGRAFLSTREGTSVSHGVLTAGGDAEKIVSLATYSDASYGIYIRFEYVDGDVESRVFWNSAGTGSEFAQTTPTRRNPNWSARVESTSPGAEWLRIGTVTVASSVISAIIDERPFYFEGAVDDSHESGWSTDGGGVANDRNADRQQYGVKDMQTFISSMRQCMEDVKGRGLKRWWDRDIGGMNIGFDADPVSGHLAVGDANFCLDGDTIGTPTLRFNAGSGLTFDRTGGDSAVGLLDFTVNSGVQMALDQTGLAVTNGLYVGSNSGTRYDDDLIVDGGVAVGFSTTNPAPNTIYVGDADFRMYFDGTDAFTYWGPNDYLYFDRSADALTWVQAGANQMVLTATTGLAIDKGLYVGSYAGVPYTNDIVIEGGIAVGFTTSDPSVADVQIGDSNFVLSFNGTDPQIKWAPNDYFYFDRDAGSNGIAQWFINGERMRLGITGLAVGQGLYVGSTAGTIYDNDINCEGGLGVGYTGNPTANTVHIGDVDHRIYLSGSNGVYRWDADSYQVHNATNSTMSWVLNASTEMSLGTTGLTILNGLSVGNMPMTVYDNDIVVTGGIAVGFESVDPDGDHVHIGNFDFQLHWDGVDPSIYFDTSDRIYYDRSLNQMKFLLGGTAELWLDSLGARIDTGLVVGWNGAPVDDRIILGNSDVFWDYDSGTGDIILQFDTGDYWNYDVSNGNLIWRQGGSNIFYLYASGVFSSLPSGGRGMIELGNSGGFTTNVTAPGSEANIYPKDESGLCRLWCDSEGGVPTRLSAHDEEGDWVHQETNYRKGVEKAVFMDDLVAAVEELTGKTFTVTRPLTSEEAAEKAETITQADEKVATWRAANPNDWLSVGKSTMRAANANPPGPPS